MIPVKVRRPGGQEPRKTRPTPDDRVRVATGEIVQAKVSDVDWYETPGGAVCTDVYSRASGDVTLEAGPRRGGYYARALGWLAVTFWQADGFDTLQDAQLQVLGWWKQATRYAK